MYLSGFLPCDSTPWVRLARACYDQNAFDKNLLFMGQSIRNEMETVKGKIGKIGTKCKEPTPCFSTLFFLDPVYPLFYNFIIKDTFETGPPNWIA